MAKAEIGVIGGSGFYEFIGGEDRADVVDLEVETPFGPPSAPVSVGEVSGVPVAFLPRHGRHHEYEPHKLNYRANLWALRSVGVRRVLGPCAVGSLRPELHPGTFVVPDQIIDRTYGRAHSIYEGSGKVIHAQFAEPYCPRLRQALLAGSDAVDGGVMVVINGPRFSTKAESLANQAAGGAIVGMTGMPEAVVARELGLCYATVSMVTDHDAGVDGQEPVTHEQVMRVFSSNIARLKHLLADVIGRLPAAEPDDTATCPCRRALDGMELPWPLP
ncbi:MAG: S-methyl-5'-thioadenosine phosphorylase [Propionibacteriaceae bacterium]|jgi:5'-methylthioadenosine phosphorylase|nr:S-methyl-5'-thioadenosine phosphorylase [Propionibacteriaceae bacterium]